MHRQFFSQCFGSGQNFFIRVQLRARLGFGAHSAVFVSLEHVAFDLTKHFNHMETVLSVRFEFSSFFAIPFKRPLYLILWENGLLLDSRHRYVTRSSFCFFVKRRHQLSELEKLGSKPRQFSPLLHEIPPPEWPCRKVTKLSLALCILIVNQTYRTCIYSALWQRSLRTPSLFTRGDLCVVCTLHIGLNHISAHYSF